MSNTRVALAGATGNLGAPILKALLDANFHVTVLTREGSTSTASLPKTANLTIAEVDYSSAASITPALKDVSVVISTLGSFAINAQQPLIDASVAAGVKRFIPSEFGSDTTNKLSAVLPVFHGKVATADYLASQSAAHPSFTYTLVITGAFLDWGLAVGFVINPGARSAAVYDGGDKPFSTTRLPTIGAAVVGIVGHLDETKNRAVYVHDTVTTQNALIAYAKKADPQNRDWDIQQVDTKKLADDSYAELKADKPNMQKAMYGFLPTAIFGEGNGGNFSGKVDNELLGIKGLTDEELEKLVGGYVKT